MKLLLAYESPTGKGGWSTYQRCSRGKIDLQVITTSVPGHIGGEEAGLLEITAEAAKFRIIRVQDDAVGTCLLDTDTVVGEALCGVEVEDPEQTCALEGEDLVDLVLEAHVGLWGV